MPPPLRALCRAVWRLVRGASSQQKWPSWWRRGQATTTTTCLIGRPLQAWWCLLCYALGRKGPELTCWAQRLGRKCRRPKLMTSSLPFHSNNPSIRPSIHRCSSASAPTPTPPRAPPSPGCSSSASPSPPSSRPQRRNRRPAPHPHMALRSAPPRMALSPSGRGPLRPAPPPRTWASSPTVRRAHCCQHGHGPHQQCVLPCSLPCCRRSCPGGARGARRAARAAAARRRALASPRLQGMIDRRSPPHCRSPATPRPRTATQAHRSPPFTSPSSPR